MKQFELANALGISTGMVSRLVKRGMPTDSVERAQRWRKRHLEPGRVKGSRFNPDEPSLKTSNIPGAPAQAVPVALTSEAERLAYGIDLELASENGLFVSLEPLRGVLRALPVSPDGPRMTLRVWLALVDHALAEDSDVRQSNEMGMLVTPYDFAELVRPGQGMSSLWLVVACDDVERMCFESELDDFSVETEPGVSVDTVDN